MVLRVWLLSRLEISNFFDTLQDHLMQDMKVYLLGTLLSFSSKIKSNRRVENIFSPMNCNAS